MTDEEIKVCIRILDTAKDALFRFSGKEHPFDMDEPLADAFYSMNTACMHLSCVLEGKEEV